MAVSSRALLRSFTGFAPFSCRRRQFHVHGSKWSFQQGLGEVPSSSCSGGSRQTGPLRSIPIPVDVHGRDFRSRCWQSTATATATATSTEEEVTTTTTTSEPSFHPTDIKYSFTPPPPLSAASREKVNNLLEKILFLDMIEVHLLTQLVHTRMGGQWEDLAGIAPAGGGMGRRAGMLDSNEGTEEDSAEPVSLNKDVKLVGFDPKDKIKVIKEVRAIIGLGLKEAKDLVESAPKVITKQLAPDKAQELKERLEAIGAKVELE